MNAYILRSQLATVHRVVPAQYIQYVDALAAWTMCVGFLLVICPVVTYALRGNDAALDSLEVQKDERCVFTARPNLGSRPWC